MTAKEDQTKTNNPYDTVTAVVHVTDTYLTEIIHQILARVPNHKPILYDDLKDFGRNSKLSKFYPMTNAFGDTYQNLTPRPPSDWKAAKLTTLFKMTKRQQLNEMHLTHQALRYEMDRVLARIVDEGLYSMGEDYEYQCEGMDRRLKMQEKACVLYANLFKRMVMIFLQLVDGKTFTDEQVQILLRTYFYVGPKHTFTRSNVCICI